MDHIEDMRSTNRGGQSAAEEPAHMHMGTSGFYEFHVVLHGLICLSLSREKRTAQLLIPNVDMHVYHAGLFQDLQELPYGHDYRLGGVRAGNWTPDMDDFGDRHLLISLSNQDGLRCQPRGTHATVTLPWPDDICGVRDLDDERSDDPLFNMPDSMNPRSLHYITYLTYKVEKSATYHPVLHWNCHEQFWRQQRLHNHMRLHFLADPDKRLNENDSGSHAAHAYSSLNDQLFHGRFPMAPKIVKGWNFHDCSPKQELIIPKSEAVDFSQIDHPGEPAVIMEYPGVPPHARLAGRGGNCVAVVVMGT